MLIIFHVCCVLHITIEDNICVYLKRLRFCGLYWILSVPGMYVSPRDLMHPHVWMTQFFS